MYRILNRAYSYYTLCVCFNHFSSQGWGCGRLEWQLADAFRCCKCVIIKLRAVAEATSSVQTVVL
jgi:hypothetical protein